MGQEMDQGRKRRNESHHDRRNQEGRREVRSENHPKHLRSDHHAHYSEITRQKKPDRPKLASSVVKNPSKMQRSRRDSDSIGRNDPCHRNSPVELYNRDGRNTESSSSSSSTDDAIHRKANYKKSKQVQSRKRSRQQEIEELADRKMRIESELRALDAEEAAKAHRRKQPNRDHSSLQHQNKGNHSHVRSVRIKQEPPSDDDESGQRRRKAHSAKRPVHVKQEPASDDDNKSRSRSQTIHRTSNMVRIKRERSESNSRSQRVHRTSTNHKRRNAMEASRSDGDNMEWGRPEHDNSEKRDGKEKEKPNFETSGKLAEDTNTFNGVVIKYNEPAEARKPRRKWRLYPFKGDTSLPFIPIHRQSAYLLGRSRLIADIPVDHPSCSKQHAVLQFRLTPYTREDGKKGKSVRPYIIDLDSSNGTFVNNKRIDARRYMELFEKDVLKFGFSSRVYVILHEDSKNPDENDDEEDN